MNEINGRLDSYVYQLRNLLQNLENLKNYSDPKEELGEKIVSEGIGMLARELFESSTVGRFGKQWADKSMKQQKKLQQKQVLSNQENSFYSLLNQIKEFLRNVSIERNNLSSKGNSGLLLKKFASIENYSKLETKIRKTIAILTQVGGEDLIYNSEIPKYLEKQRSKKQQDNYQILKKLEQEFREFIQRKLSAVSKNWWNERVPEDVRKNAEQRKKKNESPWDWVVGGSPLIDYIDFTDYAKIITRRDNWNNVFRDVFHNREELLSKLKELEPIRNAIMHSRNLNSKQIQRLQLYSDDLSGAMKKHTLV